MTKQHALPASPHFYLDELAPGVYAAVATEEGNARSNAGIVDLGRQTLLFDAFDSPDAASDLLAAAQELTGRAPSCAVISHTHWDHWGGAQAIAPHIPILTSHAIRAGMPAAVAWVEELAADPAQIDEWLAEERAALEAAGDPIQRASLERSIGRIQALGLRLPTLSFRYPDLTFDGTLVWHGSARVAELHVTAAGHTPSDIYLHLPGDRLLFMGDLGFFSSQPFMTYCDPDGWCRHLDHLAQLDVDTYVPGHGPLGTRDDLSLQRRYLAVVQELVSAAARGGVPVDEVMSQTLPAPFDTWQRANLPRWQANVQALYERSARA